MRLLFVRGTTCTSAFLQHWQNRDVRCSSVVFVDIANISLLPVRMQRFADTPTNSFPQQQATMLRQTHKSTSTTKCSTQTRIHGNPQQVGRLSPCMYGIIVKRQKRIQLSCFVSSSLKQHSTITNRNHSHCNTYLHEWARSSSKAAKIAVCVITSVQTRTHPRNITLYASARHR